MADLPNFSTANANNRSKKSPKIYLKDILNYFKDISNARGDNFDYPK